MHITNFEKSQDHHSYTEEEFKDLARGKKFAKSYDISYDKRVSMRNAWIHCRTKGTPLNVCLKFRFSVNQQFPLENAKHIQKLAHWVRVSLTRMKLNENDIHVGIESNMIWSRFQPLDECFEEDILLVYVPNHEYKRFEKQVKGWTFEAIQIERVGYDPDRVIDGKQVTIFDEMMIACDSQTVFKMPDVVSRRSAVLLGPRVFHSFKLKKVELIRHGVKARSIKTMADSQ